MSAPVISTFRSSAFIWFCRIFVGLLFIFSGLVKANDPLGFGYKLEEYFEVFGLYSLSDYSVGMAIFLCALEIILGAMLLTGLFPKLVSWGLLLLIIFFTFLTFVSAFFQVVTSCGCFGDAIPLTPWQSFSKDLVLLLLISIIFLNRNRIRPLFSNEISQALFLAATVVLSFGIGIYTSSFLPFIDFLPYKEGNYLPALMKAPEGAKLDVYETVYQLENRTSGKKKRVTDKQYLAEELWKDEDWEIVGEPETRLIEKGYQVPIGDLRITDAQDVEHTEEIVENPFYNLIIVAYNLNKTDLEAISVCDSLSSRAAEDYNIRTVLLTSASARQAEELGGELELMTEIYFADNVPLKSMIRSNPGLMLLKDGKVIKKWPHRSLPDYKELAEQYFEDNN